MTILHLFLVRVKNFSDNRRGENQIHILCSTNFFRNSCRFLVKAEDCGRARQDTDGDTAHALCILYI